MISNGNKTANVYVENCSVYIQCKGDIVVVDIKRTQKVACLRGAPAPAGPPFTISVSQENVTLLFRGICETVISYVDRCHPILVIFGRKCGNTKNVKQKCT